ncbi:M24 family metallopeptidase [Geothermobacter hydrogeniphilus]|uniref:Peptidase M24 n=1 Tax=Geothermobacter hydrogeniphilus TaxID=1969733 RepID=A0A1X0XWY7_9BACT|nr:Xaa-Pro peptidase family protein [Geothermobacter hydrogeniphilus]ORJ57400.1 peptidase M24 [Geothermobacter hydrogeniphilus]
MPIQSECRNRIANLQRQLERKELDGALVIYPIDLYYFAATRQNGMLWVPQSGEPLLLIRKSLTRARQESCITELRPFPSSRELSGLLGRPGQKVGVTFDVLPAAQLDYLKKVLPEREFVDISGINRNLRAVKSALEVARIRHAGEQLSKVFAQVPDFYTPGMRELDLAAEFESRSRKLGSEGYVRMRAYNQELFQGLLVSGGSANQPGFFDGAVTGCGLSAASPHGASTAVIAPNLPLMVDYTAVHDGYIVDMTRIFVPGNIHPEVQHAFDTALKIQRQVTAALRPGAVASELFDLACGIAAEAGLGDCFMGVPGEQAKFVGHGVGLELDEMPVLAKGFDVPLQENQTIAIEPKFLLAGHGVVGIENTWAVGPEGGIRLSPADDAIVTLPT